MIRSSSRRSWLCSAWLVAALGLATTPAQAVGTRNLVLATAKDFEAGESRGVFVDSLGVLRPGWPSVAHRTELAPSAWAMLRHKGQVLIATGSEGKLLSYQNGELSLVAQAEVMALTSLTEAFGKVLVGSMPGGKLYEFTGKELKLFAELPGAPHIWALSYDAKAKLLYVATGPEGKLFAVSADGHSQVYFDAEQEHLVSVLATGKEVYAGASGEALLYRVEGPGKASVVHDFEGTEVRGLSAADGRLYVIANKLSSGNLREYAPNSRGSAGSQKGSGQLLSVNSQGQVEELLSSKDDYFTWLSLDTDGHPLVGTGKEGRLYRVGSERDSLMLLDLESRQLAGLALDGGHGLVLGSDPLSVEEVGSPAASVPEWKSEVFDCGLRASLGHLRYEATGALEISLRTGNTKKPDSSWSDFSPALSNGTQANLPKARYVQVRVRMPAGPAELRRLELPFQTDNVRALLTQIQVEGQALSSSEPGMVSSGASIESPLGSTLKLSFKTDNPDKDQLRYRLAYQAPASSAWIDILAAEQVLTSDKYSWDTSGLPEGRYKLRVSVSDELANPKGLALSHSLELASVLVDTTPPVFTELKLVGTQLEGSVKDGVGPIRRIEYKWAGHEPFLPVGAADGVLDQAEEKFQLELSGPGAEAAGFIWVRAYDQAGNSVSKQLAFPAK